jgi:hypothetical protein
MKSTKASINTKLLLKTILLGMLGTPVLAQEGKTLQVIEVTSERTVSIASEIASETTAVLTAYENNDLRESGWLSLSVAL